MFDGGAVSVDTYGSMATTHAPATISVKTIHVQADGTFELKAYSHLNTWVVDATTILVKKKWAAKPFLHEYSCLVPATMINYIKKFSCGYIEQINYLSGPLV